jgi:hypothetical protein
MERLSPIPGRRAIVARFIPHAPDRALRIIQGGLLVTIALVGLQVASQAVDFAVFDLGIRALNSDTHHSLFGVASLLAQTAVAAVCAWRGAHALRHRRGWSLLGGLVGGLVLIRGLATFNATALAVPLASVFGLLCWLTWRDRAPARSVVWASLILMAASLLLHKVGLAADAGASAHSWAYQITSMVKHGAELAGWLLLATGIAAGVPSRQLPEPTADQVGALEMKTVAG